MYSIKQKQKKFADLIIFFAHFQNFTKKNKLLDTNLFINLPWGHVKSHTKFGPDRFSRFDFIGYKQTNRQAKYI